MALARADRRKRLEQAREKAAYDEAFMRQEFQLLWKPTLFVLAEPGSNKAFTAHR